MKMLDIMSALKHVFTGMQGQRQQEIKICLKQHTEYLRVQFIDTPVEVSSSPHWDEKDIRDVTTLVAATVTQAGRNDNI